MMRDLWWASPVTCMVWLGLQIPMGVFACYAFTVLCLEKFFHSTAYPITTDNFFYWLGECSKKWLLLCLLVMPCLAAFAFKVNSIVSPLIFLLTIVGINYALIRLCLVSPMAALKCPKPTVKSSWNLTQGGFRRIASFAVVLIAFLEVLNKMELWIAAPLGKTSIISHIIAALWQSLSLTMLSVSMIVYFCTAYRVLSNKDQST